MDASYHPWFGSDRDKCALLVLIDDATSKIPALHFCPRESLEGYFNAIEKHINRYGKPQGFYTDRHAIFKTTRERNVKFKDTQLQRAFHKLNIKLILARSPQAKGRVERANQTLQDRLVKELRLKGIYTIEEANKFLERYREIYNEKFGKEPLAAENMHRALKPGEDLKRILCPVYRRDLSKNLTIQFKNTIYQIKGHEALPKEQIEILELDNRTIEIWAKEVKLEFNKYNESYRKLSKKIKRNFG